MTHPTFPFVVCHCGATTEVHSHGPADFWRFSSHLNDRARNCQWSNLPIDQKHLEENGVNRAATAIPKADAGGDADSPMGHDPASGERIRGAPGGHGGPHRGQAEGADDRPAAGLPALRSQPEIPWGSPGVDRRTSYGGTGNKYHRIIHGLKMHHPAGASVTIDVYSVITAFRVEIPGLQHAAKKILCSGIRGKGDLIQDLHEARDALARAIEDAERAAES